ncbi:hypothetical protein L873DRAFT_1041654 [Choiromyces venosus 120613-1]|uniref:Uncharacterized protein n=1 Tax=Choiromyces venosus 120613-1 TaxID=1336337 RepID=A0A3N4JJJ7_9PEZI|nr:hypothetical protein L873DRAFT_1041654 [Choiromyces venosus 120613-1]
MAAEVLHRQETSRSQAFLRTDTTDYRAAFSSLALKQPRTNRLAAWMVDPDAPFCEQPPAKRIQLVLYSVHRVEAQLTKQTKPVDDIITLFARLALLNGYSAISKITSVSHGQSQGGRGSHSGRRNSGGAGQKTLGSKLTSGAGGNGSGGPSKRPMKRGGGGGDGEDRPSKRKKPSNEPQGQNVYLCIVFQLDQQSPERDEDHPCKKKKFATLEGLIDHHLRIHVGHIQCPDCLVRKGTTTDMGKHTRNANCTPPTIIRPEIVVHGESVHSVRTWDALCREVAPNGQILYDMARNIDSMYPKCLSSGNTRRWVGLFDQDHLLT